jgi:predicted transcriptional regulator
MAELFCKKTITEILPAVRALVALTMVERGFNQTDISKMLGTSQPAVSQYINHSRGSLANSLASNKKVMEYVLALSQKLISKYTDINTHTCEICKVTRDSGVISKEYMTPLLCLLEIKEGSNE